MALRSHAELQSRKKCVEFMQTSSSELTTLRFKQSVGERLHQVEH